MWRRASAILAGVVAALAAVALVVVFTDTETQVQGTIFVPVQDSGELEAVSVAATTSSVVIVLPDVVPPSPPPQHVRTTTVPPVKPPAPRSTPSKTPAPPPPPPPSPPKFDPAVSYRIVNHVNFLVLDSGGNVRPGTPMKLWEPGSRSTNLQFQLLETGDGYYRLVNRTNGLTVDGRGATDRGAFVGQRPWDSSPAMQWLPADAGNGLYTLVNRATGMLLDGGGPGVEFGARAKQWPANSSPNLRWRIMPA